MKVRFNLSYAAIFSLAFSIVWSSANPTLAQTPDVTREIIEKTTTTIKNPRQAEQSSSTSNCSSAPRRTERVRLYFLRQPAKIIGLVNTFAKSRNKNELTTNDICINASAPGGDQRTNEIILFGTDADILFAKQVIASVDLPLPTINMQMWGIQISSEKPKKMPAVSRAVRQEIDTTQVLIKDTLLRSRGALRRAIDGVEVDQTLKNTLTNQGYGAIFEPQNRPNTSFNLSILDMLFWTIATNESFNVNRDIARALSSYWVKIPGFQENLSEFTEEYRTVLSRNLRRDEQTPLPELGVQPLERFFRLKGVRPYCPQFVDERGNVLACDWIPAEMSAEDIENSESPCTIGDVQGSLNCDAPVNSYIARIEANGGKVFAERAADGTRRALIEFVNQYVEHLDNVSTFNPDKLSTATDEFNSLLQLSILALNKDIEKFFMDPTLKRIQKTVDDFGGVSYAQVGRTTVESINGLKTDVTSDAISNFEIIPSPTLSEILTTASELSGQLSGFIPAPEPVADAAATAATGIPLPQVLGLIGAFGEQQAQFRALNTGITLSITPNILRNLRSAELEIDLVIADPEGGGTRSEGLEPLSRIGRQTLKSTIYADAIDLFTISTFNNQSTLQGEPFVVPVVGHIWKGVFGAIPGFGSLFSFPTGTRSVQHESLILTTSFISPTATGLVTQYPRNRRVLGSVNSVPAVPPAPF